MGPDVGELHFSRFSRSVGECRRDVGSRAWYGSSFIFVARRLIPLPEYCIADTRSCIISIEPVLSKQIVKQGARQTIRLGDKDIDYSPDFRFYITTKLPNPHYLPEVCIKVTVINFTVTPQGLEEQLLADVVRNERPELEEQRDKLVVEIATGQDTLKELEDRTLKLLAESGDDILDTDDLIDTLAASKKTSMEVDESVRCAEETAVKIDQTRNLYRAIATRGSILYFVVVDLAALDPMYQTSLQFYKKLFGRVLDRAAKSDDVAERVEIVSALLTETTYNIVCRGLFEKHKVFVIVSSAFYDEESVHAHNLSCAFELSASVRVHDVCSDQQKGWRHYRCRVGLLRSRKVFFFFCVCV